MSETPVILTIGKSKAGLPVMQIKASFGEVIELTPDMVRAIYKSAEIIETLILPEIERQEMEAEKKAQWGRGDQEVYDLLSK